MSEAYPTPVADLFDSQRGRDLEMQIQEWIDSMEKKSLIRTVGVYSDGSHKSNCVKQDDLIHHVKYNLELRPGRAFFVDGVCVNRGYLDDLHLHHAARMIEGQYPLPCVYASDKYH